ncbi:retrovirus-related pol polyprotein from transposon TNT 1-94 [Tanacetum coccineum]
MEIWVQGNITIQQGLLREGLITILFSVGQLCDADLEVAFQKSTCFVRDLQGNDLLTDNRGTDLYIISLQETTSSTPICLMAKASPTQAWLWHRRLSHLNFDYNQPAFKRRMFQTKFSFKSKTVPSSKGRLNLLHMDLCGTMRVASINGKRYILVIIDDYSRYTWALFLLSKDEPLEVLKDFLTMIQRNLQSLVISVRTDRGTEFLNKTLNAFFKEEGIEHQTSTPRTPEQNGVVERRNRTLVEAARTMLSASKLPLFFWAEAIATACYTQNRSIIIPTYEKMTYHIINDRKLSIKHLYIFGCTCYLTRDGENLDKMKEKGDPCILVGYSTQSKGYRVYNKRTRLIVESIHLRFDEIKEMSKTSVANDTSGLVPQRQKASDYDNPDPALELQNVSPSADTTVPSQQELDLLFGPFELHQLDIFYNALNSNDQDSLNSAAGGNFLDKMPRECLKIIERKSKVRQSRRKAIVSKVSTSSSTPAVSSDVAELKDMVRALILDKKNQTPAPAPVKVVEQSCVTCRGGHSYQNCPATDGNIYRDNIQEYVSQATAVNYNQGNASYRP